MGSSKTHSGTSAKTPKNLSLAFVLIATALTLVFVVGGLERSPLIIEIVRDLAIVL